MKSKLVFACAFALSFVALLSKPTFAEPPYAPAPGILPVAGPAIPGPAIVPGKEYTPAGDMSNPAGGGRGPAPGNILQWDGFGGAIDVALLAMPAGGSGQIDALASTGDALFLEVVGNASALLVSSTGDPIAPVMAESIFGGVGVWATPAQVNLGGVGLPPGSPADLDALEVWGPNFASDSGKFSEAGDALTGVSIWSITGGGPVAYMTQAEVAFGLFGAPAPIEIVESIELDALMVLDGGDPGPAPLWNPGDSVLFSLAPNALLGFDGGEIWVWTNGAGFATFLSHGGHLWDTLNDVTALLGGENVDALEAVSMIPEPSSIILLGVGVIGLAGYRLRRRKSAT